mmetsp:Transcript_7484/g.15380  ORF Transcript_7484/g.15380 Transcript_7484/m.15380 type:complete len:245 (-) Transcript_7484:444-1178(-)
MVRHRLLRPRRRPPPRRLHRHHRRNHRRRHGHPRGIRTRRQIQAIPPPHSGKSLRRRPLLHARLPLHFHAQHHLLAKQRSHRAHQVRLPPRRIRHGLLAHPHGSLLQSRRDHHLHSRLRPRRNDHLPLLQRFDFRNQSLRQPRFEESPHPIHLGHVPRGGSGRHSLAVRLSGHARLVLHRRLLGVCRLQPHPAGVPERSFHFPFDGILRRSGDCHSFEWDFAPRSARGGEKEGEGRDSLVDDRG